MRIHIWNLKSSKKFLSFGLAVVFACAGLSVSASAQKTRPINEIQGEKTVSPYENQNVRIDGVVTARTRTGFFVQTPDDKTDANPNTSEAIFVFTKTEPGGEATIGNLVSVTGMVTEFRPKQEPASLPITELSMRKGTDFVSVTSKGNPLPKPIVLSVNDFASNKFYQLEKYEGMRVTADALTVTSPTGGRIDQKNSRADSNGIFYAVLKGIPRPFREPGMDIYDFIADEVAKTNPQIPVFDHNPETIRIESSAQLGAPTIEVTSKAEIRNLSGVMHYGYQAYSILVDVDSKHSVSGLIAAKPLPPPSDKQFSIASANLENFFDDVDDPNIKEDITTPEGFELRLKKISRAFREYLQLPDVIAVIECENLLTLKRLADRINSEEVAAKKSNPKYEAFLIDGNDGRGIDSGFLIKTSRVKVNEVFQFGKDEKYIHPTKKDEIFLNDRPPLAARVSIGDTSFTVVANHLKSFRGFDDEKDAPNVRLKKRLQAEFLAKWVGERQKANPNEKILLVGDFNHYQFSDGILDVIGTLTGNPAPKEKVLIPTEDLLEPNLTNLVDLIKADAKYSYLFDGQAQVLDHFLINDAMKKHLAGFGFARLNADFPESYRGDGNRVERYSDHDVAVGYFNISDAPIVTASSPKPADSPKPVPSRGSTKSN